MCFTKGFCDGKLETRGCRGWCWDVDDYDNDNENDYIDRDDKVTTKRTRK